MQEGEIDNIIDTNRTIYIRINKKTANTVSWAIETFMDEDARGSEHCAKGKRSHCKGG
jgi:hypothetical protein